MGQLIKFLAYKCSWNPAVSLKRISWHYNGEMLRKYSYFLVEAAKGKRCKIKSTNLISGYFRTNVLIKLSSRYVMKKVIPFRTYMPITVAIVVGQFYFLERYDLL